MPIVHAQFTCKRILSLFACMYDGRILGAYRILVNPTSGGSPPLGGIPTSLYLSIYPVTVASWRCGFLSWHVEYVSSEHYCHDICKYVEPFQSLHASTTYMTIVELFDEYPSPSSPEMTMIVIDHDTSIYMYIE